MKLKLHNLLIVAVMTVCVCCQKSKEKVKDFEYLMGKGKSHWQYVQTEEDRDQINLFRRVYERRHSSHQILKEEIPKTVHFIWVGPKNFPKSSRKNVESWIKKHPGWQFKFWTDRIRPLPHPKMEMVRINTKHFLHLEQEYEDSDNYAEKSDVLRYEILSQEGGFYVDHDVMCYQSFEPLRQKYQFFCGLEPPHKPIANTSISVCNNIIASVPQHPVLDRSIQKVKSRWNLIKQMYPGSDQESVIYRVFHRTFCPFDESVTESILTLNDQNMVFPAAFFNRLDGDFAYFANHEYLGTWYKTEDPFETLMRKRLIKMSRKMNQVILICSVTVAIHLILAGCIIFFLRRKHVQ